MRPCLGVCCLKGDNRIYISGPEERVILLLARLQPSSEARDEAVSLMAGPGPFDFERLYRLAQQNGVLPLLHYHTREMEVVPEELRQRVRQQCLASSASNIVQAEEALRIIGLLEKAGIAAMPLKGALASEIVFADPGLYPSSDIDMLVRPAQLDAARAVLAGEGYTSEASADSLQRQAHYHLNLSKGRHHIELHWNLVKRYYCADPDSWWEDVRHLEFRGRQLVFPAPERYILYLVFRLFDHAFYPLKFLVLIAEVISRHRHELDWAALLAMARRLRMQRLLTFVLHLQHDLLGGCRPPEPLAVQPVGYDLLRRMVLSGLFSVDGRVHLRMLLFTFLLDSPAAIVRVLLRRLFPPVAEIRLRYGLREGSPMTIFYYILNPVLMLVRRRVK